MRKSVRALDKTNGNQLRKTLICLALPIAQLDNLPLRTLNSLTSSRENNIGVCLCEQSSANIRIFAFSRSRAITLICASYEISHSRHTCIPIHRHKWEVREKLIDLRSTMGSYGPTVIYLTVYCMSNYLCMTQDNKSSLSL